jgi:hypothetical protein
VFWDLGVYDTQMKKLITLGILAAGIAAADIPFPQCLPCPPPPPSGCQVVTQEPITVYVPIYIGGYGYVMVPQIQYITVYRPC